MKGTTIAVSLLLLMPWLATPVQAEASPDFVNYQGVLRDASNVPLEGEHDMVFRYFDADVAGAEIMIERHTAADGNPVTVTEGLFNVHLGSGILVDGSGGGTYTNLPRVFRYHTDVWLSVEIGGELLDPRVRIAASPYAHNADFLDGNNSSYFLNTGSGSQEKTGLIVASGGVDYGPGADDDLGAADVTALTAGGSADGLHTHASVGGSDTLDGLDSSQFLRSDTSDSFDSGTLTVGGAATLEVAGASVFNQLAINGNSLELNQDGPDGTFSINFFDGGSASGEWFWWDDSEDEFAISDALRVRGDVYGVEADGLEAGGYFFDSTESGEGWIGGGGYGAYLQGDIVGMYGQDSSNGTFAYVGYGSYTIYGNGTKNFVQNHPHAADQVIVYAAPEGGEAATYTRGTARLENGEARVPLEETFSWVTNPDIGLTAHLTSRGQDAILYVESVTTKELVVRASAGSPSDAVFDYMVWGLRIGFEEIGVVQEKGVEEARIPSMDSHRQSREKHPEWDRHVPLERFREMRQAIGQSAEIDLCASLALRDAVGEYDPAIHGTPREEHEPGEPAVPEIEGQDGPPPLDAGVGGGGSTEGVAVTRMPHPDGPIVTDGDGNAYARSFRPSLAELAEHHPVGEPVTVGDVLVVDPDRTGVLRLGYDMADPAVVGIVAGNPGLLLGNGEAADEETDGELHELAPIAFTGTVLCKVDAGYGSVRVGDLLMTSPTLGHAMRADEPLPGTIVGKALEPLDTGSGLIRVIVMLR